jgi:ribosomal-protein-alanine N-acetyltransferase
LAQARHAQGEAIFLEVRESNAAARAFYEKLGFEQMGRRKGYYADGLEDAIIYRRMLK